MLIQNGLAIGESVSTAGKKIKGRIRPMILKLLKEESSKLNIFKASYASFEVVLAPALINASKAMKRGRAKQNPYCGTHILKAVHHAIGRVGDKSPYSVNIAAVEILEFNDGVTIRRFVSK